MAGLGLTVPQMAALLGISKATFERRVKEDDALAEALEKGRALAANEITGKAFSMAASGNHPAMTMFWLKCRQGWKETSVQQVTGANDGPVEISHVPTLTDEQLNARYLALLEKAKSNGG